MRSYHKTGGFVGRPAYRVSAMFRNKFFKIKFRVCADKIQIFKKKAFNRYSRKNVG